MHIRTPLAWSLDAREACRTWLSRSADNYASHSVAQYTAMVGTAADWLHEHRQLNLLTAQANDLDAFLKSLRGRQDQPASSSTLRRYVSTLGKLYGHLVGEGLRQDNPMEALQRHQLQSGPARSAPRFLSWAQSERYIEWLDHQHPQGWCDSRDAALRAIYLATGITVEESLQLKVHDLHLGTVNGNLQIRTRSPLTTRQLVLPVWSLASLRAWAEHRAGLGVGGQILFVARHRSPTTSVDGGIPSAHAVSTSELYDIVRPAVEAAGLADGQLGPQTLRNSYAVRQLHQGVDNQTLMRWMGLRTSFSIDAIRRELDQLNGPVPA
jgi:integrase/recombinase XerD